MPRGPSRSNMTAAKTREHSVDDVAGGGVAGGGTVNGCGIRHRSTA